MYLKLSIIITLIIVSVSCFATNVPSERIVGKWTTENGKSHVEIYKQNNKYYGKIVWLKEPLNDQGTEKKDDNNPDKNKRSQKILNLVVLKDLSYESGDLWAGGTIYDPKNGKTYKVKITYKNNKEIEIRGFIGVSLIGRSSIWTRE